MVLGVKVHETNMISSSPPKNNIDIVDVIFYFISKLTFRVFASAATVNTLIKYFVWQFQNVGWDFIL